MICNGLHLNDILGTHFESASLLWVIWENCFDLCCWIWLANLWLQNCHCCFSIKTKYIVLPGGRRFSPLFDTWHCFCRNLFSLISSATHFHAMGFPLLFWFATFSVLQLMFTMFTKIWQKNFKAGKAVVTMQILLNFLGSGVILVSGGKFRHTLISLQTEISQFALALHFPLMIFKVKMIKKKLW